MIIFDKNYKKLFMIFILMIFILIVSLLFLINPSEYTCFLLPNKNLVFVVGIIGILFSIYILYKTIFIIFKNSYKFYIDEIGIYDNVNYTGCYIIEWKDIVEIKRHRINLWGSGILIFLKSPEEYLEKQTYIQKFFMKNVLNKFGTPILLQNTTLNCSIEYLEKVLLDSWEKYKSDLLVDKR